MKTILYNPIFINPQAYYVFPNLNGQLVEQKDATIEPAKYSGIIEVKVIANGDSKLIRYYSKLIQNQKLIKNNYGKDI